LSNSLRDAIRLRENDGYAIINSNQFINIGENFSINETQDAIDTAWSGSKLVISDNVVRNTKMIGLDIKMVSMDGTKGSRSVIIANNHISDVWGTGIVLHGDIEGTQGYASNYSLLVEGNIIERCAQIGNMMESAIWVKGSAKYITIADNQALFNRGRGIKVQSRSGIADGTAVGATITGNTVVNNGVNHPSVNSFGILVQGVDSLILTGNLAADDTTLENAGEQDVGIYVSGAQNAIISNNLARCHQGGQILVGSPPVTPSGNLIIDSTDSSCQ